MNEVSFIHKLQERAKEQENMLKAVPFPIFFTFIVKWFSFHPWRLLIPLAFFLSIFLRITLGPSYTDSILALFRWWS